MWGSRDFKNDYGLTHAYLAGAMHKGIASPELVIKLEQSRHIGF
jgi:trans-AT polyketide synthase/acyltransferase/oxidoreductase domain-containing protein